MSVADCAETKLLAPNKKATAVAAKTSFFITASFFNYFCSKLMPKHRTLA
jgi:hypothetical protein